MNAASKHTLSAALVGVVGMAFMTHTHACGLPVMQPGESPSWGKAVVADNSSDAALLVGAPNQGGDLSASNANPIVGLWAFKFVAGTTTIDQGYTTWHSDGTELTNSGRPPITSSFCMGVWKKLGNVIKLNHWALSWEPDGTTFDGPTNIRESVIVDHTGNSYSGTFSIDQYAPDGTFLFHAVDGTVTATRITAN